MQKLFIKCPRILPKFCYYFSLLNILHTKNIHSPLLPSVQREKDDVMTRAALAAAPGSPPLPPGVTAGWDLGPLPPGTSVAFAIWTCGLYEH